MAFEADDIIPVSLGGDPFDINNLAASHRICNQRRGNRPLGGDGHGPGRGGAGPMPVNPATLPQSRDW